MRSIRRRRMEKKTDYKSRLALLKSGRPRLVVRKTNRYIVAQIVTTDIAQDSILIGMSTKDLIKAGWPKEKSGSLKSLAACYALGSILANKAKDLDLGSKLVLDFGMHRNIHKSRIYALLKGALDAGLEIDHNPEVLPSEEELNKSGLLETAQKIIKK